MGPSDAFRGVSQGAWLMATDLISLLGEAVELLESHDRCPVGSHWNDARNKCEPIPDEARNLLRKATGAGAKAAKMSRQAREYSKALHKSAHLDAQHAHGAAAHALKTAGFHSLAKRSRSAADSHAARAKGFE